MTDHMISIDCANKTFNSHGRRTHALNSVSIKVAAGERVALLGASGSGKSTLIRCICGLETLDESSESLWVNGLLMQSGGKIGKDVRAIRSTIGVIFQQFNLVNQLDVISNVLIGFAAQKNIFQLISKQFSAEEKALALDALEKVGMVDFAYQRASTLSGGQQQRVAVARALVKGSKVLLADEPVASLDPESARKVMDLISSLSDQYGLTLITSLHQIPVARKYCDRTIALHKGNLVFDGKTSHLDAEALARLYGSNIGDIEMEEDLVPITNQDERPQLVLVQ